MKNLRFLIILISIFGALNGFSQSLSSQGKAHLRAAETLAQSASTGEDYIQVAEEYEKILNTDPSFNDAYIEAAHAYALATPSLGKTAYDKGVSILNRLKSKTSSYESEIYSEMTVLDAMMKKHNNGPSRIYGTWGQYGNGEFYPFVKITGSGGTPDVEFLGYWMAGSQGSIKDVRINVAGNTCYLEFDKYWDDRPSLRKKGWTHYVEDCDSNADPGYPTTGQYRYDESYNTHYYKIDLAEYPLEAKCYKIHSNYYLKGSHTYSETDTDTKIFSKNLQKR